MKSQLRNALNSTLLRRVAHPLRANDPKLYATLNRIRQRLITGGSAFQACQLTAMEAFCSIANPDGSDHVLEIGSDPDLRVLRELKRRGFGKTIGINNAEEVWADHPEGRIEREGAVLLKGDAAHISMADESVDYIFSISVFEHLLDLGAALNEMYRVLRPGGVVYAKFGPIWSSGKGHHLRVEVNGEEARHFLPTKNPLPDHCHLLMSEDEMRRSLLSRVSPMLLEPIVRWVYHDDGINRLLHHEYVEHFEACALNVVSLRPERDPLDPQLKRILEFRHPGESSFDVTNAEVVLTKR